MQSLRERGKQRRRDDVLIAARTLVLEGGAEALTMRALAERAEVSVPTIYGLIGSRDAVVAAMLERGGEQFADALAAHDDDPVVRIHAAIDVFCAGLSANEPVARELVRAIVPWSEVPGAARQRLGAAWTDAFADAQRAGIIDRACLPDHLSDHLSALLLGELLQWAERTTSITSIAARLHHGAAMVLATRARPAWRDELRRACDRAARAARSEEGSAS